MIARRAVTRRALLAGSAAVVAAARIGGAQAFAGDPFTLGVASGNPGPDSVILWTRLAPEPLAPDPDRPGGMPPEPVAVRWEVGLDDRLSQIVCNGEAAAMPEYAHA
jgi:alkaline phosphatase D